MNYIKMENLQKKNLICRHPHAIFNMENITFYSIIA